jgi:metallophosphoesterase (TIGR00282 family)
MRLLFVGDVFGRVGREALHRTLPLLRSQHHPDFVIVNAENAAAGSGITPATAQSLFAEDGVHIITLGNHTWSKREIYPYLDAEPRILRPANYGPHVPGHGWHTIQASPHNLCVISMQGRVFMDPVASPFETADNILGSLPEDTAVVVDFHAEATAEKAALAHYLDGRVGAVLGTHTHVQTADARILPGGTAFITDVGMTGPMHSVIGVKPQAAVEKLRTLLPQRFEPAEGEAQLCAVLVELQGKSAKSIHNIQVYPA